MAIAPLRYGAGVKGKVNQALSHGIPVVGTSVSFEGMYVRDREHVSIADMPAHFAESMAGLHEDPSLWARLSRNGPSSIEEQFSTGAARETLEQLLTDALSQRLG